MKAQTRDFLAKFNARYPIIQAPMAGASTIEMAAIVSNYGAIGSLPLGSYSEKPTKILDQVTKYQSLVNDKNLVNLNFFTHEVIKHNDEIEKNWIDRYNSIYKKYGINKQITKLDKLYDTFKSIDDINHETIKSLVELKPQIISFHFGLPNIEVLKHLQKNGINIFITATSLEEFKQLIEVGVDGVILQGWEAGGHRGNFIANDPNDEKLSTLELVSRIVSYIDENEMESVPWIIATGGIVDKEKIEKLLTFGIAGVQLGTVFLSAALSTSSKHLKEVIKDPFNRKTAMYPAISGRNLRSINTPFLNELNDIEISKIPSYPLPYDSFKQLNIDSKDEQFQSLLVGSEFFKSWKGTDDLTEILNSLVKDLNY